MRQSPFQEGSMPDLAHIMPPPWMIPIHASETLTEANSKEPQ